MARSEAIQKFQRVNTVRKQRLVRELADARSAETQAATEEQRAETALETATVQAEEARHFVSANPACEQTRLWQGVTQSKQVDAGQQLEVAKDDHYAATLARAESARAVQHHDLKVDRLEEYRRNLARLEARQAEIRSED